MRPSWKLALIGGEVTVLAAFTGIGIHLAMQPHRIAFRPPPIVLPATRPDDPTRWHAADSATRDYSSGSRSLRTRA